ncbi:cysteine peptidase family C39 domain-containing protein, partial [Flavobacterium sp. NRK1]|uniref:cysteine peptidase family C39 domain-containing protein n=1 Tax=Flavobacterium sp. NRK1 TaxID=2954929 RepID=UPI002092F2A2
MDCGPACLAMISQYYGKKYSLSSLREKSYLTREGVSLLSIAEAAGTIGFESIPVKVALGALISLVEKKPCILHWDQNHFVVLLKIEKRPFSNKLVFKIADPAYGILKVSVEDMSKHWCSGNDKGIALFLDPVPGFVEERLPYEKK